MSTGRPRYYAQRYFETIAITLNGLLRSAHTCLVGMDLIEDIFQLEVLELRLLADARNGMSRLSMVIDTLPNNGVVCSSVTPHSLVVVHIQDLDTVVSEIDQSFQALRAEYDLSRQKLRAQSDRSMYPHLKLYLWMMDGVAMSIESVICDCELVREILPHWRTIMA